MFFYFNIILSGMSLYQVIKLLKQNDEQIKSVILVYNDKVKEYDKKKDKLKYCFVFRIH